MFTYVDMCKCYSLVYVLLMDNIGIPMALSSVLCLQCITAPADLVTVQRIQPLFKESVQYDLPKKLLEPINHCFFYFEIMEVHKFHFYCTHSV